MLYRICFFFIGAFLLQCPVAAKEQELLVEGYFDGYKIFDQGPYAIKFNKKAFLSIKKVEKVPQLEAPFLMPPLVDAHVHSMVFKDPHHHSLKEELAFNHGLSKSQYEDMILKYLGAMRKSGFLFLRDLGGPDRGEVLLKGLLSRHSDLPYVQMTTASLSWGQGQCFKGYNCATHFTDISTWEQRKREEFIKNYQGDFLKVYLDNDPVAGKMPLSIAADLIRLSKKYSLKVALHIRHDIRDTSVLDGEHVSFEHFNLQVNKVSKIRATLVPTLYPQSFKSQISAGKSAYHHDHIDHLGSLKEILEKKSFCFGSDFYYLSHDPVRSVGFYSLESLFEYKKLGFSNLELLKSITTNCYSLFKKNFSLGAIKVGAPAHFLLIEGNPAKSLKDLHNIKALYKEGQKL